MIASLAELRRSLLSLSLDPLSKNGQILRHFHDACRPCFDPENVADDFDILLAVVESVGCACALIPRREELLAQLLSISADGSMPTRSPETESKLLGTLFECASGRLVSSVLSVRPELAGSIFEFGNGPLHLAALRDDGEALSVVEALVDAGADLDRPNEAQRRPLHRVLTDEIALFLLDSGADPLAGDRSGERPLDHWIRMGLWRPAAKVLAASPELWGSPAPGGVCLASFAADALPSYASGSSEALAAFCDSGADFTGLCPLAGTPIASPFSSRADLLSIAEYGAFSTMAVPASDPYRSPSSKLAQCL